MSDYTNDGCACQPNTCIKCAVTSCAHHCKDAQYCGLGSIQVSPCGESSSGAHTDCSNYCRC